MKNRTLTTLARTAVAFCAVASIILGGTKAFADAEADLLVSYDASYASSVGGEDNAQVNAANAIASCNDINDRSGTGGRLRIVGYHQAAQNLYQATSKGGYVNWMASYDSRMTDIVDAGNARGADLVTFICVSTSDGAAAVAQQPGRYSAFDPAYVWGPIIAHELAGHNYGCDHSGGKGDLPAAYPKSVMMHNYCNGGGSSPPYLYSNPNIWLGGVRMQGVGSTCLGGAVNNGDNAYYKSTTAQGVADSYARVITAPNLGNVVRDWSFNQAAGSAPAGTTVTDSITGTELATVQGNGATFTGNGLAIPGGASGSGAAYLQLPAGLISAYTNVTIEIWAQEFSAQNWARVMDFNNGTANYITLAASKGTDLNSQRFESVVGGATVTLDSGLVTATGVLHHYAITYASTGSGSGRWTWYRDGDQVAYLDVAYALSSLQDVNNWLGRSAYASDSFANCEYQEVRISSVAMSRDEVLANYSLGPNHVASTVMLTADDALGASSFNASGNWSDGLAPGAGKSYETYRFRLRTPADATSRTFAGQSLNVDGGAITWKGTSSSTITINDLTVNGDCELLNAGSGTFTLAGNLKVNSPGAMLRAANGPINLSANLSGDGDLLHVNNTVTLSGNNTNFTGKTIVGDGRFSSIQIDSEARLGANPTNFVADQLTFNRGILYNTGNLTISNSNRGIRVGVSAALFNVAPGTTLTLAVPLSSPASGDSLQTSPLYPNPVSGMLIKDNSGTLSLTHPNNSHAGEVVINAGVLSVDGGGRLNNGDQAMPVTDNGTLTINTTAGQNIGGVISGAGALIKNNSGTLTINGANTLSGAVTVNGGTLYANPANAANGRAFSYVSGITVNSGGTLQASGNGFFGWDGTQEHPITVNAGGTLTCDSGADVGVGTVTLNGGTLANLGASAAYGSWRFDDATDALLVTDNSTVSAVNVKFGNPSACVNVSAGKTLTVNGTITDATGGGASYLTISNGTGTVLLTGANTCSGTTTIGSGRLILTNTASLASSNIITGPGATFDVAGLATIFTVGSGKSLGGSGTNNGSVTTVSGAKIYAGPDGGYGTNTFNQNLTLVSGASLGFDLNTSAAGANDKLVVLGNLNLTNTAFHIKAPGTGSNLDSVSDYLLVTVSGTLSGTVSSTPVWDVPPGNYGAFAVIITNGNQIVLHAVAVPPSFTSGSVTPGSVGRNQWVAISAVVNEGLYSISNVTANATNIGGPAALPLVSDGAGNYTNSVAISADTGLGARNILLLATDSGNISTATNLPITVVTTNRVWSGGSVSDNNWGSNPNWSTGAAPGFIGDGIVFDGSARLAPVMETNYTATGVTFNNTAGSFTVGTTSSTLTLTGGVTNNSTSAQTLNVSVTMTGSQTIAAASGNVTLGRALAIGTNTLSVTGPSNTVVSGAVTGGGSLFKQGAGALTFSSSSAWGGAGASSGGFSGPLIAQAGVLTFNGGTAAVTGELVIGGVVANGGAGNNARVVVNNATLNVSSWFSVGRGNGVGGVSSDLVLTNAAVVTCSNLSAGFNGGSSANLPKGSMTLNNNSSFTLVGNGAVNFAESAGSDMTLTLTNTAQFIAAGSSQEFLGEFGKGTVNLNGSSLMVLGTGGVNVGYRSGTGVVSVANSAALRVPGELRVGGSDTSGTGNNGFGTVNLSGGAITVGSLTVARGNDYQNGVAGDVNLAGGTFTSTNDVILGYAGTGRARLNMNGGTFHVGTTATKWLIVPFYDTAKAEINLTNGALNLNSGSSIKFSRGNTSTAGSPNVINQKGGTVTFYSDFATTPGGTGNLDLAYSGASTITNIYNLDGGTLTVPQIIAGISGPTRQFNFNGGTLKAAVSSATFFSGNVASVANVRNGGAVIDTGVNSITIGQRLVHSTLAGDNATDGGLTKLGGGTLTLTNANTYTGNTAIGAGTLVLAAGSSIAGSPAIIVSNAATFDVSAAGYLLVAGRTLKGYGTVVGNVTNAGTISPGGSIGRLTVNGNVTLQPGGTTVVEISKSPLTNDQLRVTGALTCGGMLVVTNISGTLAATDSFQLFSDGSTSGTFVATNLPPLNPGLGWSFNSASGVLSVIQTVATNPTNISCTVGSGNITLTWPADHTGWRLQAQTNALNTGLGTNWADVSGSSQTNNMVFPVNATGGSVFYRLTFP